ncbi:MAG: hypothetical protein QOE11_903 [Solirubrobacteraceae bacterium]|jgi:hypothetical protein|nr:hypothetical protein [Solirubrobacteraceae bacterium]
MLDVSKRPEVNDMAAKDKAGAAAAAARGARENPYVQRIIQDEELRDNMVVAYEAAKNAFGRLNNGKAPTKALIEDKKLHKDLKRSADALRDATVALRDAPKHSKPKSKRKGGMGKLLLLALIGAVAAVALSEGLRGKVLDALFGAEEEFDYTSNTAPAAPPTEAAPIT